MVQQLKDDFYGEMYGFVKKHSAINNDFIDRFARGDISVSEFRRFSEEFYHFTREWDSIVLVCKPQPEFFFKFQYAICAQPEFLLADRIYYMAAFTRCRVPERSLDKHPCVQWFRQRG